MAIFNNSTQLGSSLSSSPSSTPRFGSIGANSAESTARQRMLGLGGNSFGGLDPSDPHYTDKLMAQSSALNAQTNMAKAGINTDTSPFGDLDPNDPHYANKLIAQSSALNAQTGMQKALNPAQEVSNKHADILQDIRLGTNPSSKVEELSDAQKFWGTKSKSLFDRDLV